MADARSIARKLSGGSRFVNDVRCHLHEMIWMGERAGPAVAPPLYASVHDCLVMAGASAER